MGFFLFIIKKKGELKMFKVELPDGSKLEYDEEVTVKDIAYNIGKRLGEDAVAAEVNNEMVDLNYSINSDVNLSIITIDSEKGLDISRHTAAHVMAQAVERLFDDVKLAIGPTIDDGFYYDFDLEHRFSPEDLEEIEKEMRKIINEDLEIKREELPKEKALEIMRKK